MYIRTKTIKKQEYAYLVASKWNKKRKTSKQRFGRYLGKVYNLNKTYNLELKDIIKGMDIDSYLENTAISIIFKDLITLDLLNHNLKRNKEIFSGDGFYLDLKNLKIYNEKMNPCVIKMNNGYLCDYTIKNLFSINPSSENEVLFGKELARAFIESGIGIDKELFVLLFDKIYKKEVP